MKRFSKSARQVLLSSTIAIAASMNGGCRSIEYFSRATNADQFTNAFSSEEINSLKANAQLEAERKTKTQRNAYVAMKLFEIDRSYYNFVTLLNASDTGVISFADFAQLGLTTAATAIPVVQTTKVLATAATAVGGARAIYNEDLLRTQTLQAIQTQMEADRLKIRNIIVSRMDACEISEYPMGFVLADLQSYAAAGTPDSAIVALTNSATKAKQAASTPSSTANPDSGSGGGGGGDGKKGPPISVPIPARLGTLSVSYAPPNVCPLHTGPKAASGIAALY